MRTSEHLTVGELYSRKRLQEKFDITDRNLNNGVFIPRGHSSVWLFVTEFKSPDASPTVTGWKATRRAETGSGRGARTGTSSSIGRAAWSYCCSTARAGTSIQTTRFDMRVRLSINRTKASFPPTSC